MDDRLLIFKTVAEQKNFSQAARQLHLSQPAISMHIQYLEEYYGAKLFDRTTKQVALTAAGKILYTYAEQYIKLQAEAKKAIGEATGMVKGSLQLGATLTIGEYLLPKIVGLFKATHPQVTVRMDIANTKHIIERLATNELDVGLIEGPVNHRDLQQENFMQDELVVVMPPKHQWSGQKAISARELLGAQLIIREKGSGTRMIMEERFQAQGLYLKDFQVAMELGSTQAIKEAVMAGLGVAIISLLTIQRELQWGVLNYVPLTGVQLLRDLNICYNKHKFRTLTTAAFLTLLREREKVL